MRKIILSILLVLILLSTLCTDCFEAYGEAYSKEVFTDGDWHYCVDDKNNITITKYSGNLTSAVVPDHINNRAVTAIGTAAFFDSPVEQITLPDSLERVDWWAFYGCKSLESVQFGKGVRTIGYGAFMNCKSLKSVELPMSVNSIGDDAFAVRCKVRKNIKDIYSHKMISKEEYSTDFDFEIIGYSGTAAEKYAEEHLLHFSKAGSIMYGDADLNGVVDDSDVGAVQKYIDGKISFSDIQLCNADVNGDSTVNEDDLQLIKDYSQNKISYYALPVAKGLYTAPDYLSGKTMYCDGDSVAKGTGTNITGDNFYSYCNYISDTYNMPMVNNAVAGTTLAKQKNKTKDSNKSILERVTCIRGSYDVILLDGGFNDLFQNIKIGEVTPDSDKSGKYDEYTTAGALESICYFLQKNYSDSLKLFVIGHKRNKNPEQYKYWNVIRQVLDKWDIDYIDISEKTQLCDVNEEIATQYFMFNNGKGDGIHPLAYASKKIYGPCVASKLNEMAQRRVGLELSQSEITMGFLENCTVSADFSGCVNGAVLRWSSDDESIASVDENGIITAAGTGTTTIRVCSQDGKTAEIKINVCLMPVEIKLNYNSLNLKIGESAELSTQLSSGTASFVTHYTSSDISVASVGEDNGTVTAVSPGKAVITCHTANGLRAECTVTVS